MRRLAAVAAGLAGVVVFVVPAGARERNPHAPVKTTTTQPAATTTAAVKPVTTATATTSTTAGSTGCVQVAPGVDIGVAINARPAGTAFCLSGTYHVGVTAIVKTGDRLTGVPGTVLDGGGTTSTGLAGYGTSQADVTVDGLTFTGFAGGGAAGLIAAVRTGDRWHVLNSTFTNNRIGLAAYGAGDEIRGNVFASNWQYGVIGGPAVLAGNEITRNNTRSFDPGDAGGTKFVRAAGMSITGNWVHDNAGPGLWCDTDCTGIVYDGNTVERNLIAGIFHELSGQAVIRNNTVTGNGLVSGGLFYQADILVATSHDVDVYGNTVASNGNGIGITDTDRGCVCAAANDTVHNNTITLTGHGIAAGLDGRPAAYSAGNRFQANRYDVPDPTGAWWQWSGRAVPWGAWQADGQDTTGAVT